MERPPARQAAALDEVVDDLVHWRRVSVEAVAAAERDEAQAGSCLARMSASETAAVNAAAETDGSVQNVMGETDRSRREVSEAGSSVRFGVEGVERSTRYVQQTAVRWRSGGRRPLQLAQLGNAAAGQAARRLDGCQPRCRAVAGRVQTAAAMGDALVSAAAEREAMAGAQWARARGAAHLEALRASARVRAAGEEAWLRTQRAVARLSEQEEALRRFDRPAEQAH